MSKIKLTEARLVRLVENAARKVLKEMSSWRDEYCDTGYAYIYLESIIRWADIDPDMEDELSSKIKPEYEDVTIEYEMTAREFEGYEYTEDEIQNAYAGKEELSVFTNFIDMFDGLTPEEIQVCQEIQKNVKSILEKINPDIVDSEKARRSEKEEGDREDYWEGRREEGW